MAQTGSIHNDSGVTLNGSGLSDTEVALLKQRAAQYAARASHQESTAQSQMMTLLVFNLGEERYGIDVMTVRAVRVLPRITRVPGIPTFYRGVVNLRGQIITVLDLSRFFNIPLPEHDPKELIVVQVNSLEIGLLADLVTDVERVSRDALQPFEQFRHTLGVTAQRLVVLDLQQMFDDERLVAGAADD